MKRFRFTISIGRKIIYQSILTFTKKQQDSYIQDVLSLGKEKILEEVGKIIGKRRLVKESPSWEDISFNDFKNKYSELLICIIIQHDIYKKLSRDLADFYLPVTVMYFTEEIEKTELKNLKCKCVYLKD